MSQGSNCSLSAILDLFDEGALGDDVYGHDSHSDWAADEPQDKPTAPEQAQVPDSEVDEAALEAGIDTDSERRRTSRKRKARDSTDDCTTDEDAAVDSRWQVLENAHQHILRSVMAADSEAKSTAGYTAETGRETIEAEIKERAPRALRLPPLFIRQQIQNGAGIFGFDDA